MHTKLLAKINNKLYKAACNDKNEYLATNQAHFPTLQSASGDQSCTPLCVHAQSQHYQTGISYDTFPKL